MLFDTLKRKNKAEQEEQEWNANRPADYVSQNKEAMDALTGQIGSGYDGSELAKAYQQYRDQTADTAAAADNTRANAAALSGGYGNSWADSLAAQGQGAATANVDAALTALRSRALNEYKNRQSGLVEALSGMGNTEALDRSAYGSNLSNWYNRQNFLANQSAQARNENDNYWNNLWNGIRTVGNVAKSAYDGYMGYTQQQWENEFAREQWEYNKNRTDQSDALSAYQQAFNLYTQGAGDAASDVLTRYGLNADAFANYTGAPITQDDQASVLSTAASLVASGNQEAAANLLKMYGMDASAAGNYGTLTSRLLSTAAAKAAATKTGSSSGSGRRSSGRSGSSGTASGYTTSQLTSMANKFSSMKDTNPLYSHYKEVLTDAGWLEPETVSGTTGTLTAPPVVEPYTPASSKLRLSNTGNHTTQKATSGQTSNTSTGMPYSNALSYAKGWKAKGLNANEIATRLMNMGASDDVIDKAMLNAGF